MRKSNNASHRIYALEGYWPQTPSRGLLGSTLQEISRKHGITYIHKAPLTLQQLKTALLQWTFQEMDSYDILCLSFHGDNGLIYIGNTRFYLEDIISIIGNSGRGRTIYFSSCYTLNIPQAKIRQFMKQTGLSRVIGFEDSVPIEKSIIHDKRNLLMLLEI